MRRRRAASINRLSARTAIAILTLVSLGLVGIVIAFTPQPSIETQPLPPPGDLQGSAAVQAALADPTVRSLLAGKKYRVLQVQSIMDSKAGFPADALYVWIYDYTANEAIAVVVGSDNKVLQVLTHLNIGLAQVEIDSASAIARADPRFSALVSKRDVRLDAFQIADDPSHQCSTQRCVGIQISIYDPTVAPPVIPSNQTTPSALGGYRPIAVFIVSLLSDDVVAVENLEG